MPNYLNEIRSLKHDLQKMATQQRSSAFRYDSCPDPLETSLEDHANAIYRFPYKILSVTSIGHITNLAIFPSDTLFSN